MKRETLYLSLPRYLQNALIGVEGYRIRRSRYNRHFTQTLQQYEARSLWDASRTCRFRDERLRQMIQHAATSVPYYREMFPAQRIDPRDIRTLHDLSILPVLTKSEVQAEPRRFVSEAVRSSSTSTQHTSGSTGAGLRFPATADAIREQWAAWWRYRGWHGLLRGEKCLYFGGRSIVPLRQQRSPYWRYNVAENQTFFSGYHLGPDTADAYLAEMKRSGARWIHGYPSLISLIGQYAIERDVRIDMQWVTIGAESLLPHQAVIIERAFGVRPLQHYGMAEGVANISQCPLGRLHVDEDFAAVEFLPTASGDFRIIGTSLANQAFPLLRYDVGDLASHSPNSCHCGRPGRIVESIDGRQEDYLLTKQGRRLGRLDHIFKDSVNVREAQIHQPRQGYAEIRLVKGPHFDASDEQQLIREIRSRFGDELDFEITYTSQILRTTRGKLRFVVSSVPTCSTGEIVPA